MQAPEDVVINPEDEEILSDDDIVVTPEEINRITEALKRFETLEAGQVRPV